MTIEYKLPFTAEEIEQKLGKVGEPVSFNDLTDKPFYEEASVVEVSVSATWDNTEGKAMVSTPIGLVIGEAYTVTWNGVDYEVTGLDINALSGGQYPGVGLGNPAALGGEDTGEPFGICDFGIDITGENASGVYGYIIPVNSTYDENMSIHHHSTTVHHIEGKYLPNGMGYIEGGGMVEILPETTLTEENYNAEVAAIPALGLVAGNTYIVKLNGTEYSCVAWAVEENDGVTIVGIGDAYTMSEGALGTAATGEPFVLMELPPEIAAEAGMNVAIQPIGELALPVVFSITGGGAIIHKLDNRCLDLAWLPTVTKDYAELLPETDVAATMILYGWSYYYLDHRFVGLVAGDTYIVTWNGVEYECTAEDYDSALGKGIAIGDMQMFGGTSNGLPFVIFDNDGTLDGAPNGFNVAPFDGSTNPIVSIRKVVAVPNKLPNEFLNLAWLPTYIGEWAEYISEYTTSTSSNGSTFTDVPALTVGAKYLVTFDGVEYECTAIDRSVEGYTMVSAGNFSLFMGGNDTYENTGEPFYMLSENQMDRVGVYVQDYSTAHTVSVKVLEEVPNKLPAEFLPDGIGGGAYNVYFTVDSDGNATTNQTYEEVWAKATDPNVMVRAVITQDNTVFYAPLIGCEGAVEAGVMYFSCVYYVLEGDHARSIMWVSDGTITYEKK